MLSILLSVVQDGLDNGDIVAHHAKATIAAHAQQTAPLASDMIVVYRKTKTAELVSPSLGQAAGCTDAALGLKQSIIIRDCHALLLEIAPTNGLRGTLGIGTVVLGVGGRAFDTPATMLSVPSIRPMGALRRSHHGC